MTVIPAVMANRVLFLIACHLVAALSSPPPGGKKPIQPGDVNVVKVANFAAGQLNLASNSEYALVMTSVVEGTQQVCSVRLGLCAESEKTRPRGVSLAPSALYYTFISLGDVWSEV